MIQWRLQKERQLEFRWHEEAATVEKPIASLNSPFNVIRTRIGSTVERMEGFLDRR